MNIKRIFIAFMFGMILTSCFQVSDSFGNVGEATVVPIIGDSYMVDIDDSSIKKYNSTHAAVGIRVFHEKPGWGRYFVIDVEWSNGASAHRVDNGAEMEIELAQTVASYLQNK